jgi:hypothetical protein
MDVVTIEKAAMAITTQAMDARMMCEVCGDIGHSGDYCPCYLGGCDVYEWQQLWLSSTRKSIMESITPLLSGGNQGNTYNPNQPSLKYLVFGQAKINEGFNKKTIAYDKALESLNVKIDNLSSTITNQLSFNKMIETKLS